MNEPGCLRATTILTADIHCHDDVNQLHIVCVRAGVFGCLLLNYINEICQWNKKIYLCAFTHFPLAVLDKCVPRFSPNADTTMTTPTKFVSHLRLHFFHTWLCFPASFFFFLLLFLCHFGFRCANCDYVRVCVCVDVPVQIQWRIQTAGLSLSLYHNNHLYKMKLLRQRHRTI